MGIAAQPRGRVVSGDPWQIAESEPDVVEHAVVELTQFFPSSAIQRGAALALARKCPGTPRTARGTSDRQADRIQGLVGSR